MTFREIHREAWFWMAGVSGLALLVTAFVVWPFAPMSTLAVLAAVIRGALILFTGSAVFLMPLPYFQRAGLMLATVGMFMTTQSLLNPHTPWEAWASIISGAGWLAFVASSFGPDLWKRIAAIGDEREE